MSDMITLALMDDILRQTTIQEKSFPLWNVPLTKGTVSRVLSDGSVADLPLGAFGSRKAVSPSGLTASSNQSKFTVMGSMAINTTQAILVYSDGATVYTCVATESNYVVTYGTAIAIEATALSQYVGATSAGSDGLIVSLGSGKYMTWYITPSGTKAIILTVSGTTVSIGGSYLIASSFNGTMAQMTAGSKYIFTYQGTNIIQAVILTISGTTIALGSVATIFSSSFYAMSCQGLSASSAVVVYSTSTSTFVVALSAASTTITMGSPLNLNVFGEKGSISIWALSANAIVVFHAGITQYGSGSVCTISGTVVTAAASSVGSLSASSSVNSMNVIQLSAGVFAVFTISISGNAIYTTSVAVVNCAVDGSTASTSTLTTISTDTGGFGGLALAYDAANKRVTFIYGSTNPTMGILTWSGSSTIFTLNNAGIVQPNAAGATNASIAWNYGNAVFLSADKVLLHFASKLSSTLTQSAYVMATPVAALQFPLGNSNIAVGIATGGSKVALKGIVPITGANLTAGAQYYYDPNGNLTMVGAGNTILGKAISPTEIVLKDYIF